MSFLKYHLPKHLALWVLGRTVDRPLDLSYLVRVLALSIGGVVVGAFLTLTAIGFGAAALFVYLTHDIALSESKSLMIVCASCVALAGGTFAYVRYVMSTMKPLTLEHFHDKFAHMDGEIMEKIGYTLKNFAKGFVEK